MHDIFETLEQTEMWYGQDDYPYKLSEMEQSHRINVKNFLERRAQQLHSRGLWREFKMMERAPEDVFDAWMAENANSITGDPVDWLHSKPFMKALEQAIKNHDTIDGEVVDITIPGEIGHVVGSITMADAKKSVRDGVYRMKRSPTGRLVFSTSPPLQGIGHCVETKAEEPPAAEPFECFIGHAGCDSEEKCTENRYQDWKNSHDTEECGGMQNGCQLCAHIW